MQLERERSPQPGLRLPQAKLSRKSNQVARGRICRFKSYMPSQAVRSSNASHVNVAQIGAEERGAAALAHVLSVNPTVKIYAPKEGFGIYGSSLPSSFYRKAEALPPDMRYFDGKPPEVMTFGSAWQGANFELIDKTTEILPGITLIALVSEAPGTRELKELSLAINTPDGVVLVVGCSHPGIDKIVEAAATINPKIHLIAGGFHLVAASDDAISKIVAALKDTFKVEIIAPGHCTGEPTFAALKQAFGDHYIYAGLGTSFATGSGAGAEQRRGEAPALDAEDLVSYRRLAAREDPFGLATWRRKLADRDSDGAKR